jgi:hypothetical protein
MTLMAGIVLISMILLLMFIVAVSVVATALIVLIGLTLGFLPSAMRPRKREDRMLVATGIVVGLFVLCVAAGAVAVETSAEGGPRTETLGCPSLAG